MIKNKAHSVAVIQGLDGSGKSTAALSAAERLSAVRPDADIRVSDSTGLYSYRGGELIGHRHQKLKDLAPTEASGRLGKYARLGAFTAGRMLEDAGARRADLLIGVRDPFRIDPAVMLAAYSSRMGKLSPETRLRMLDRVTRSPRADSIVHLQMDPEVAMRSVASRGADKLDPHETPEKMAILADELPLVMGAYSRMYGTEIADVTALTPGTADEVTAAIEPLVPTPSFQVSIPDHGNIDVHTRQIAV